jgi:hypothetical protein
MFGKFSKKKPNVVETEVKSKQKNDLQSLTLAPKLQSQTLAPKLQSLTLAPKLQSQTLAPKLLPDLKPIRKLLKFLNLKQSMYLQSLV